MSLPADELLAHIATTLRTDIGPAVPDPFARTQAFMAAVILEKLAAEFRATELSGTTAAQEAQSIAQAIEAETRAEGADALPRLRAALDGLRRDGGDARWGALVRALYDERDALGEARFERALGHVRHALRVRLDRVLVYAA